MKFQKEILDFNIISEFKKVYVVTHIQLEFQTVKYFMYSVLIPLMTEVDEEETLTTLFKLKQRLWELNGVNVKVEAEDIRLMIAVLDRRLRHCDERRIELDKLEPKNELNASIVLNEAGVRYTQSLTSFNNLSFRQESYDKMSELRTLLFNALFSIPTLK